MLSLLTKHPVYSYLIDRPDVLVRDLHPHPLAKVHLVAHSPIEVEELALAMQVNLSRPVAETRDCYDLSQNKASLKLFYQ